MVDETTLIVISTIVQTVVITLTLIIFTLSFRSQEKATREASYQGLMGRYNDLIATIADKPEIIKIMMTDTAGLDPGVSKEDAEVYAHLIHGYGIIEEAYTLRQKGWIDEENWRQWAAFLRALARHPLFEPMCNRTHGTFDPGFEAFVQTVLKEQKEKSAKASGSGAAAQ